MNPSNSQNNQVSSKTERGTGRMNFGNCAEIKVTLKKETVSTADIQSGKVKVFSLFGKLFRF